MNSPFQKHKLNLVVCGMVLSTIFLVATIFIGAHRNKFKTQQALNSPAVIRLKTILTNWNTGPFVSITSRENLEPLITDRVSHLDEFDKLSKQKQKFLIDSICKLLIAYNSSDSADYFAFRIPSGVRNSSHAYAFNQQKMNEYVRSLPSLDEAKKAIKKAGGSDTSVSEYNLSDPLYVVGQYRNLLVSASHNPQNGIVTCANCWTGCNLESLMLYVERVTNGVADLTSLNKITTLPNVGFVKPSPSIIFTPSPTELVNAQGYVECATVVLTIKVERSGVQAYPVSVLWYWSPAQEAWLPHEIILLCKLNSTDIFF
jgi:hypothetical protein